jgi:hypothetical protein
MIIDIGHDNRVGNKTQSEINLFSEKTSRQTPLHKKRKEFWQPVQQIDFQEGYKLVLFQKIEEDFTVNLSAYWIKNFGRYFLLKNDFG